MELSSDPFRQEILTENRWKVGNQRRRLAHGVSLQSWPLITAGCETNLASLEDTPLLQISTAFRTLPHKKGPITQRHHLTQFLGRVCSSDVYAPCARGHRERGSLDAVDLPGDPPEHRVARPAPSLTTPAFAGNPLYALLPEGHDPTAYGIQRCPSIIPFSTCSRTSITSPDFRRTFPPFPWLPLSSQPTDSFRFKSETLMGGPK